VSVVKKVSIQFKGINCILPIILFPIVQINVSWLIVCRLLIVHSLKYHSLRAIISIIFTIIVYTAASQIVPSSNFVSF
jgi:hypothetical protein